MSGGADTGRWGWRLRAAVIGVALSLCLVWLVGLVAKEGLVLDGVALVTISYLASWVPMLGTLTAVSYIDGQRSFRLDFGLRFTWLDLLFGLTAGLILRSVSTAIEIAIYGRPAGGGISFGPTIYDVWWILVAIVAPVLIAPVIEELFFRGLLQRAVQKTSRRSMAASTRLSAITAVSVSSLVFSAVHLLQTSGGAQAAVVGISTLILGIGLGTIAAVTGRLGGSIVAHIVFNGLGVLAIVI